MTTKYGPVKTDHILFIASGAFHVSAPSDLLPEMQGRFPIRVELKSLEQADLMRILTEPELNLISQAKYLLSSENLEVVFEDESLEEIARIAHMVNTEVENIGARRLNTIIEKVLEDLSFNAPSLSGQTIRITKEYVIEKIDNLAHNTDLSKFIL